MKFCVIGVGRFGYHVATTLAEHGMDVMAIDSKEEVIAAIRDNVTQAICMKVTDENALRSIGIEEMDVIIVAMGENFAESILVTALLKQKINVSMVIARAVSPIHRDILTLIGADRVVMPEQEMAVKLADNLSLPFSGLTRLAPEFSVAHIKAPHKWVGKTIADLDLFDQFSLHCVGTKTKNSMAPQPADYCVEDGDTLVLAGKTNDIANLVKNTDE